MSFKRKKRFLNAEQLREKKKKTIYRIAVVIGVLACIGFSVRIFYITDSPRIRKFPGASNFTLPGLDPDLNADNVRIARVEIENDVLKERLTDFEKVLFELKEEKELVNHDNKLLLQATKTLQNQLSNIETQYQQEQARSPTASLLDVEAPQLQTWGETEPREERNVLCEIPAGTIVKCVLVSAADCSVAVQKPSGPNMLLLRPLSNGKLPRNVRVPLKGSVIIGNGIGDLSSERVYIRGERMTLVQKNGDFIEAEISAFVSGEDGKEGMRGVVVDRSGSIIARAAFASFLQGVGQGIQATLNNQTLEKISKVGDSSVILDVDTYRNSGLQGTTTALTKMADYYIKRAEQLQPSIQLQAGRIVDVVFTKAVKIGNKDQARSLSSEKAIRSLNAS